MPKRRRSQKFRNRSPKQNFAVKLNHVTVRVITLGVLLAVLITRYGSKQSIKPSTQQSLHAPTATSPIPVIQVAVKSSSKQNSKSVTPAVPVPDWAISRRLDATPIAKSLSIPSRQAGKQNSQVVYNLKKPPNFKDSQELQGIVNNLVELAADENLPKEALSVTLINAKTGETAGYQQDIPRYPASVVKMFWMVVLYAQIDSGIWQNERDFAPYLAKMIQESDNEAASFIIDQVTGTRSESELKSEKFQLWKNKRQQLNRFFQEAGYKNLNIIQKTFPVDYLNLQEPEGSESQLLNNPVGNWNKITTKHAARLLYEMCYAEHAVSLQASRKMCGWLKRDLNPKIWQPPDSYDFNPVRSFFGESLPDTRVRFYSKAGATSASRSEAAMVVTEDNKTAYILAVFAPDSAYADDGQIFPKMSALVYKRMTSGSSR
ncbi:MAG: class A beta-lactamase-related serine hydrolase [Brasilonema octagenarum HA4186-MV1]|uniref:Beta-lactamase class A catalytic domain-containing protein n=2 Tax=Brasilonema TaxID=383614 RepID=A0A856MEI8_9CYAN|nr:MULTISPECIES: serine hydrolase [Brasilonema]MBW4627913.1 class A beta-lactamase-related serine hydrolase [Brasilonema octagenarum HA4186-MV1]NMF62890.1 hypothetical protein [Brasilonema octagenarum UFV-OR1]QDL08700.1 hypothetical protein DP114_13090 [Brasilonema sennae CENA114]QDL15056.1 hypothetical protein DP113_13030 [Brasilonema octagenarum UFV-E1]